MGLNINLVQALGVPKNCKCPKCGKTIATGFDDYDMECGEPNPNPGSWILDIYCPRCEHEFTLAYKISLQQLTTGKPSTGTNTKQIL